MHGDFSSSLFKRLPDEGNDLKAMFFCPFGMVWNGFESPDSPDHIQWLDTTSPTGLRVLSFRYLKITGEYQRKMTHTYIYIYIHIYIYTNVTLTFVSGLAKNDHVYLTCTNTGCSETWGFLRWKHVLSSWISGWDRLTAHPEAIYRYIANDF